MKQGTAGPEACEETAQLALDVRLGKNLGERRVGKGIAGWTLGSVVQS